MDDAKAVAVFSELIEDNRKRLFGYIYSMLQNMADAEEVYQNTTVVLWQKFAEYELGTSFGSWALKVAYYNIKNFQRSQARTRVFFSDSVMEKVAECYQQLGNDESDSRLDALVTCLKQMSEKNQQLLRLRYSESKPIRDLAELDNKSVAAITMVLVRLRKSLLRCIKSQLALT